MTLAHFTDPNLVVVPPACRDLENIVRELVACLEKYGCVEKGGPFEKDVLAHESLVSTVYDEIAYPSAHSAVVTELSFAVGLLPNGIGWGEKALPVRAVILFAVPPSEEQTYSSLVLAFAQFFKSEQKRLAFLQCAEPTEVITLLDQVSLIRTGPRRSGWER